MSDEQTQMVETTQGQDAPAPTSPAPVAALTGKRTNWTIAHKIEGQLIKFAIKGAGELVLDVAKVHAGNRAKAEMHGFVQRISDAAAMARDSKTGASATPQQKFEAMRRLVEHYASGAEGWSPPREAGVGAGVKVIKVDRDRELLAMALGIHAPEKDAGTIAKFVQGLSKAQVTGLLVSEQLRESVELAREEMNKEEMKLAEGVDAVELLSGL